MGNRRRKRRKRTVAQRRAKPAEAAASEAARARRALRLVVMCYLFVAVLYAAKIPAGKGPDETAHLRYVEWLAQHHSLPVFDRTNPGPDYEFHQPPLYYVLCWPSYVLAKGGEVGGQVVRFFSLLISVALLYLTFALGRAMVPERPWCALAATGIAAFLPMHVYLSVSISNDILTEIWFAAALLLMVHYLRAAGRYRAGEANAPPGPSAMMSVGALIGLGLLTKSLAILLLPVAWFAAALGGRGPTGYEWRRLAREVLLSTGVALILGGWWLVRNQQLYGGLLAHQAFLSAFVDRPSPQYFMSTYNVGVGGYVVIVGFWTLASALGVFGPVTGNRFVFLPMWVYIIGGLAAVVGAVGFVRYLARAQLAPWQRQAWWVCGCLGVLLVASFVRFNLSFFQAQARYMFPGLLPAAALAFCLGLEEITPAGRKRWPLLAAVAALAAVSFVGLPVWIMPEFQSP